MTSPSSFWGHQTGQGFEAELRWRPAARWQFVASHSRQNSQDGLSQSEVADVPRQLWRVEVEAPLADAWALHLQGQRVAGRLRAPGDARPPVADYSLVHLALRWRDAALPGWSATMRVNNLLDRDAREPSPAPGGIPNDFPLPRRTVALELRYGF